MPNKLARKEASRARCILFFLVVIPLVLMPDDVLRPLGAFGLGYIIRDILHKYVK